MSEVWVLDSSGLIHMKKHSISAANQWAVFKQMEEMVIAGEIALCRPVIREVGEVMHPDVPGAWALAMREFCVHPLDPGYEHLGAVMAVAADLVDPNKTKEDADPYVIAQALHLAAIGLEATVVTQDRIDRLPIKIAMTTACARVAVPCSLIDDFLEAIDVPYKATPDP